MSLQIDLDAVQSRVSAALRDLPGATDLYLFGSRARGTGDGYSDIDVEVFTADLAAAKKVWPGFLARVAHIEVAFPLVGALAGVQVDAAYMLLLRGESSYHTVDVGLRDTVERDSFAAAMPEAVRLWHLEPGCGQADQPPGQTYTPAPGTAGHLLFDELISGVRYVKARKRGQPLTCWRYMRGRPQRWMQLVSDELNGWREPGQSLTTPDIKALDARLSHAQLAEFERHLDWSAPGKMDGCFRWFTQQTVELTLRWAAAGHEFVPQEPVDRLLGFMWGELGLASRSAVGRLQSGISRATMDQQRITLLFDLGDTIMDESTEVKDAEGTTTAAELIPGMADALRSFRAAGHRLAIVADSRPNTPPNVLRQHGLLELFEYLAISEVVGAAAGVASIDKPDPRIFLAALDALGISESDYGRVVMVGNNLERDIVGANRLGLISVFFHWNERRRTQPLTAEEAPTHTVTSARELVELVTAISGES